VKFNFDSYRANTTPTLHEAESELTDVLGNDSSHKIIITEYKIQLPLDL